MNDNTSAPSKPSAITPGAALTPQQARDAGAADQAQQEMSNPGASSGAHEPQQQGERAEKGVRQQNQNPNQKQQQAETGNRSGQQDASNHGSPSQQQGDSTPRQKHQDQR